MRRPYFRNRARRAEEDAAVRREVRPAAAEGAGDAEEADMNDRVGLGWRPELAAGILANLDRIDVIEVIADDYFDSPARVRALETLAAQAPVVLHGIALGMASTAPVDRKRLAKMAKLVEQIRPESWSEHLAFVRAGEIEIGHLAAPPRTQSTIDSTAENLDIARKMVGSLPLVENIATLIDPPASCLAEPEWLTRTVKTSGAGLLLDLHNLYANSINFGIDPQDFLARLPLDRVRAVHISGGRFIGEENERRLLDDHLHDPPDPIYDLLAEVAERCPNPLTVILERDGSYPRMEHLISQLDRARSALAEGRARERAKAGTVFGVAVC
jgi:uncharacterized protein (UPF0276 family)